MILAPVVPSKCKFCGVNFAIQNYLTGIVVFHCATKWDSQRGGKDGLWSQSPECKAGLCASAVSANGCDENLAAA